MSHRTQFAGLAAPDPGDSPATVLNGDFIYANPDLVDQFLKIGAVSHRHDAHAGLPLPQVPPTAVVIPSDGSLNGETSYYIAYTVVDALGGETEAAPYVEVVTGGQISAPVSGPAVSVDTTGGYKLAGLYAYALTYTDGEGGETTLGPTTYITVNPGTASASVVLSDLVAGLEAASGAAWRAYESYEANNWQLAATGTSDSYTDSGIAATTNAAPPNTNTTGNTSSIEVTLPGPNVEPAVASGVAMNVYLSAAPSFASPALYAQIPIGSGLAPGSGENITLTIASETTAAGQPPAVSTAIPGAGQIFPDSDLVFGLKSPVASPEQLPPGTVGDVRVALNNNHFWGVVGPASAGDAGGWVDLTAAAAISVGGPGWGSAWVQAAAEYLSSDGTSIDDFAPLNGPHSSAAMAIDNGLLTTSDYTQTWPLLQGPTVVTGEPAALATILWPTTRDDDDTTEVGYINGTTPPEGDTASLYNGAFPINRAPIGINIFYLQYSEWDDTGTPIGGPTTVNPWYIAGCVDGPDDYPADTTPVPTWSPENPMGIYAYWYPESGGSASTNPFVGLQGLTDAPWASGLCLGDSLTITLEGVDNHYPLTYYWDGTQWSPTFVNSETGLGYFPDDNAGEKDVTTYVEFWRSEPAKPNLYAYQWTAPGEQSGDYKLRIHVRGYDQMSKYDALSSFSPWVGVTLGMQSESEGLTFYTNTLEQIGWTTGPADLLFCQGSHPPSALVNPATANFGGASATNGPVTTTINYDYDPARDGQESWLNTLSDFWLEIWRVGATAYAAMYFADPAAGANAPTIYSYDLTGTEFETSDPGYCGFIFPYLNDRGGIADLEVIQLNNHFVEEPHATGITFEGSGGVAIQVDDQGSGGIKVTFGLGPDVGNGGGGVGGSGFAVSDGTTTVHAPISELTFSGATVSNAGGGSAQVTVDGGGGGSLDVSVYNIEDAQEGETTTSVSHIRFIDPTALDSSFIAAYGTGVLPVIVDFDDDAFDDGGSGTANVALFVPPQQVSDASANASVAPFSVRFVGSGIASVGVEDIGAGSAQVTVTVPPATTGATGPAGASGANGTNGMNGAAGMTGPAGSSAVFVASAGTASGIVGPFLGVAGSGVASAQLVEQGGSAVILITVPPVAGPTGPAGASGANGAIGAAGASGANGTNGTNGTNGATGAQGPTGPGGSAAMSVDDGMHLVNPVSDIRFVGATVASLGGGSAQVTITSTGGGGAAAIAVADSAGDTVNPIAEITFTASGDASVGVSNQTGGSALVTIGAADPRFTVQDNVGGSARAGGGKAGPSPIEFVGSGVASATVTSTGGSAIVTITVPAVAGPPGTQGVQGVVGASGANGTNGTNGTNGATGPAGASAATATFGVDDGLHLVAPIADIRFQASGNASVGVSSLGGGSAMVTIGATGGGGGGGGPVQGFTVGASAGASAVVNDTYLEFDASGGVGVSVATLGTGSAQILIGPSPTRLQVGVRGGTYVYAQAASNIQVYSRSATDGSLTAGQLIAIPGASSPNGPHISPDGQSLYVPNNGTGSNGTVAQFRVAPNGTLTALGTVAFGIANAIPWTIAFSPNSQYVYVASNATFPASSGGICVYRRNADSSLTLIQSVTTETTSNHYCGSVAVSPDGLFLYADAFGQLLTFSIHPDGTLTQSSSVTYKTSPTTAAGGIVVSPDGRHVYLGDSDTEVVWLYQRNSNTGALSSPASITTGGNFVGSTGLTMSGDGSNVYAGLNGTAAIEFTRNPATGVLTNNSTFGGANAIGVVVSPDGFNVYTTLTIATPTLDQFSRKTNTIAALTPSTITLPGSSFSAGALCISPLAQSAAQANDIEFIAGAGITLGLASGGSSPGGSAGVTISAQQPVVAASGGASAVMADYYTEYAGSGGVSVSVQAMGGGSARVLIGGGDGGLATLAGGTVTVTDPSVTSTMRIMLTAQDNNSTGSLRVSARTPGVSFAITSSNAGDTGVVAYQFFGT